jgi:26S proteasome regulatory subunit T5
MIDSVIFNEISESVKNLTDDEIRNRIRMIDNNTRQFRLEASKMKQDLAKVNEELKDNQSKIRQNKQLPWLVSNIV